MPTPKWALPALWLVGCVGPEGLWVPPEQTQGTVVLEAPTIEPTYEWVLYALDVGSRDEGFDLDGDGQPDNALSSWSASVDPLMASAWADATSGTVIQLGLVADLSDDPAVEVGLFTVTDPDGDGWFDPSGVDADGVPLASARTALVDGAYDVVLSHSAAVRVGDAAFESATPVHLLGETHGDDHSGLLGFGVHAESLLPTMTALGMDPDELALMADLADLDTNADGEPDTVSAAFRFSAAPAQ